MALGVLFRPGYFFTGEMSYNVRFGVAKGYGYFYLKQQVTATSLKK